jgi:hypothetical protein
MISSNWLVIIVWTIAVLVCVLVLDPPRCPGGNIIQIGQLWLNGCSQ